MSWSVVATALPIAPSKNELSRSLCSSSSTSSGVVLCFSSIFPSSVRFRRSSFYPSPQLTEKRKTNTSTSRSTKQICRATSEYKFPDPIPEFAEAETEKFRTHLVKRLSKKDIYEDSVEEVVNVCTEIFSTFLHTEYGGPGTLLVLPFIDMAETVHGRGLPGASQAARVAVKWATNHVDKDWNEWTGSD
ncbi:protein PLASTID REDOX INSENSITIVE 2, chloroplastic isoform X1 [Humulus lupulus]|uniref:protein PLASTID REDOX INSENSITIVE 2, chloroplastic isoform X1 n=1 Tax=Humulus lupulus TaxID=3486 RepID=UPI002B41182B|nr:protein PLASTID REDOX INSENSITIVE 2, chloroplastic isoform X1 [Humulus lupulus]XP_062078504.1 protein PLASTID REDOX INSENSITIVE 2, chloroplastic isoform X1 [Humulus lupulus]XP_062078505.1 protein PLASTID REDOX INSENSITIVE 2, chloroplastic isoform X1 [Humulus lupulus]XP_062078506.1 protein PLASTID REDOX INSENSITIVE 2, chloroplastic isoform X1 [Humulus lupulus]XP_062078508.1 protein PLASTID REDOX INSENSITIVE 2, chloroplastic isoform X1 [Humulus lupulus]XP_062078509.1 protein PLASTID REDOX INS